MLIFIKFTIGEDVDKEIKVHKIRHDNFKSRAWFVRLLHFDNVDQR